MPEAFSGAGPQKSYTNRTADTTVDFLELSKRQKEIVGGLLDKAIQDPEYAKGPIHQLLMAMAEGAGKIQYKDYAHEAGSPEFDDMVTLALQRDIEDYVLSSLLFRAVHSNGAVANVPDKNIRPYLELAFHAQIRLGDTLKGLTGDEFSAALNVILDDISAEIHKEPAKSRN